MVSGCAGVMTRPGSRWGQAGSCRCRLLHPYIPGCLEALAAVFVGLPLSRLSALPRC